MNLGRVLVLATALTSLSGCVSETATSPAGQLDLSAILSRKDRIFENGFLYKPGFAPDDSLSARLAPLLVQEASRTVIIDEKSTLTVHATEGTLALPQGDYVQLTYVWRRVSCPGGSATRSLQGFRMTLNSAGTPVLWECLPEPNGTQAVFVSRSLEEAALRCHGAPLPGRRFSIEAAVDQRPPLLVAGVVDDGPTPMGPIVYLEAKTGAITTFLCRCSTAQVRNVSATALYTLQPAESLSLSLAELPEITALTQRQVHWLLSPATALPRRLRLPDAF